MTMTVSTAVSAAGPTAGSAIVRSLPTPYDPPSDSLTVATPSCAGCCCCCCCCLNAVAFGTGLTAGAAYGVAAKNRGDGVFGTMLGFCAVPAGLSVAWGTAVSEVGLPWWPLFLGWLVSIAMSAAALGAGGMRLWPAVLLSASFVGATTGLIVLELPMVLVTGGLIELLVPASLVAGVLVGRSIARDEPTSWPEDALWE